MILADTPIWIDYFKGTQSNQTDLLDLLLQNDVILIGDLIYCEILQGMREQKEFDLVNRYLSNLRCVDLGGFEVAYRAACNYRLLRQKGITVRKTVAMFIGTWCIMNEAELLHNDKDFNELEEHLGLKVIR